MVGSTGRVVTFEPDPLVWPRLLEAVRRNDKLPITPRQEAVTTGSGTAVLHVPPTAGWSTLLDCDYPEVDAVNVRTTSLDDLLGEDLDLGPG